MAKASRPNPSRIKVRGDLKGLRSHGLRPIVIWARDVSSTRLRLEAHRQPLAVASSAQATGDQQFVEAVSDRPVR